MKKNILRKLRVSDFVGGIWLKFANKIPSEEQIYSFLSLQEPKCSSLSFFFSNLWRGVGPIVGKGKEKKIEI